MNFLIHSRTLTPILSGKCEKKDESNMSGGTSCLSVTVSVLGVIFCACSVTGIAMSLFLVFGDPLPTSFTQDTYSPYWEDIGTLQKKDENRKKKHFVI